MVFFFVAKVLRLWLLLKILSQNRQKLLPILEWLFC
ncbi:hypothetical protein Q787_10915 [Ornithobacterium rhinotracheale H06-030791]|nr:hypothetical protein Q785_11390 [Ornithobacterium rhinotracheale ORT-UMN 88]KGB65828.1 hypothetical protein Q787_10915 [Ornithobacterium rhinotracheale H06-030791]